MADVGDGAGQLSPSQQEALQQYLQVTNQEVKDAVPLLQRSQWNVQVRRAPATSNQPRDSLADVCASACLDCHRQVL